MSTKAGEVQSDFGGNQAWLGLSFMLNATEPVASSLICMSAATVRLQGRRARTSASSMMWSVRSSISFLMSACKCAKPSQSRWPMRFISGCCCSARESPMARRLPRHSITASGVGVHSHSFWMMGNCRSTITGSRTRFDRLPSVATTDYLRVHCTLPNTS